MKKTTIRLEEFNNCPGKKRMNQYLYESNLSPYVQIVDVKDKELRNERDTLVFSILPGATETQVAISLGKLAVYFAADDFSWEVIEGQYVIRIWWD